MKILITGFAGFIGSHVCEKFIENNHEVWGIDNLSTGHKGNIKSFENKMKGIVIDDINNINLYFDNIAFDQIIHLAALADVVPSIKNPRKYFNSNVSGTLSIIEFMKNRNIKKIIYTASSSCYGIPKNYPTSEEELIDTRYPYALTKFTAEQYVKHFSSLYNFEAISLRLFNVYGPRARTTGTYGAVFGTFLKQILSNTPLTIVGDGEQSRDFIFVTDVASAFLSSSNSKIKGYNVFNVGNGRPMTINYLAKLLNPVGIVNIPDRPGEPRQTFANISKIKEILGWEPSIKFEDGVKIMIKNINYWKDAPLWDKSSISVETKDWFKYVK
jgi:UDP-glucose 4-epimerase